MNSISFSVSSDSTLQEKLDSIIQDGFKPTLGIVFSSPHVSFQNLPNIFKSYNLPFMGCTTMREIIDDEICEKSISVLLLDIDPACFSLIQKDFIDNNAFAASEELGKIALETFENPGIILYTSGLTIDGASVVNGIKSAIKREIPVYGGLAADDFKLERTHVYTADGVNDAGLVALVFNTDKIAMQGMSYSGWEGIGAMRTITKSESNMVYEIDGKPALDEFRKYFGELNYESDEGRDNILTTPGHFPLKIYREENVAILRSILSYDESGRALVLAGGVDEGDKFKFCSTPSFDVLEDTIEKFRTLKKDVQEVDAMIMNSCAARMTVFGPMLEDEIESIYGFWDKPMVGLMAYGEIGNLASRNSSWEFHNVTCTLVTLKEKV